MTLLERKARSRDEIEKGSNVKVEGSSGGFEECLQARHSSNHAELGDKVNAGSGALVAGDGI